MSSSINYQQAVIACHRFGFSPTANQLEEAAKDPITFVTQQLTVPQFSSNLPTSHDIQRMFVQIREEKRNGDMTNRHYPKQTYLTLSYDTLKQAIDSDHSVNWRLLDFFSNHFSVSANDQFMRAMAPTLEREAIAPHLSGSFVQMLVAVTQHPAMLVYLNNEKSFGPHSRLGQRGKGMNENLAREILELHTLGVNGGYQQQDVQELAKAITGWGLPHTRKDNTTGFYFRQAGHEPGQRIVMNKVYQEDGVQQGINILKDLARHPSTAQHLCQKLAMHFVEDTPSPEMVEAMVQTWSDTDGNIRQVMETLFHHDTAWRPSANKFKSPREFFISTYRMCGLQPKSPLKAIQDLEKMGQKPFNAGSPEGYEDITAAWNGASALEARIEWAASIAAMTRHGPMEIMQQSFASQLSETTFNMVSRASSQQSGLSLLLLCPQSILR